MRQTERTIARLQAGRKAKHKARALLDPELFDAIFGDGPVPQFGGGDAEAAGKEYHIGSASWGSMLPRAKGPIKVPRLNPRQQAMLDSLSEIAQGLHQRPAGPDLD